ncbi:MAG: GGDEF domain-containing protein [Ectothiorhodospiraceae bacterium]|nr:GGDEF domain-containing protein [Ectothiorhodospiraceae bacterium]
MALPSALSRVFHHELEQPRSMLCFYGAWPAAVVLAPLIAVEMSTGEHLHAGLEGAALLLTLVMPLCFKTEPRMRWVRLAMAALVLVAFFAVLTTRMQTMAGLVWLPMFPFFVYLFAGPRPGHAMIGCMVAGYVALAPFEHLGFHGAVTLSCALLLATIMVNSYEWALQSHHSRLTDLANVDHLTGLATRRALEAFLEARMETSDSSRPLTVLILDLDHFKRINDEQGHGAGDAALRRVGQLIREQLRHGQLAGRWGGDEFVVVLPGVAPERAAAMGESILQLARERASLTLSAGIAMHVEGESAHDLVHRADAALYRAKTSGRSQISLALA